MGDPFQRQGSRIEAFSDGVFAIIITILVLDLKLPALPHGASDREILNALISLTPKLLSFLFSFLLVAIYWVNHHAFFHSIARTNRTFTWLNINLLFWLCFIPFPTSVIGDYPLSVTSNALYGLTTLFCSVSYWILAGYACRAHLSDHPDGQTDISRRAYFSRVGVALYTLSVVLAFVQPILSILIFIIVPALYFVPQSFKKTATSK